MYHQYTYFMLSRKCTDQELGPYHTYDIVAYSSLCQDPVAVIQDVSTNSGLVFQMIQRFNDYKLLPIHLKDAVLDMLE